MLVLLGMVESGFYALSKDMIACIGKMVLCKARQKIRRMGGPEGASTQLFGGVFSRRRGCGFCFSWAA